MLLPNFDSKQFAQEMQNVVDYSLGFLDGVQRGKSRFLESLGEATIEQMKQFIDSMARTDPGMLQHMYEWEQTGSPSARLFDLQYTVSNLGLSINSTFRQSQAIKNGSNVPFYDKARIMEYGIPVTIKPVRAKVLAFTDGNSEVFTKQPVFVKDPGGPEAQGGFERTFDIFFENYFSQAFLISSGILDYLQNPIVYKKNLKAGQRMGRPKGTQTGYRWIANVGVNT